MYWDTLNRNIDKDYNMYKNLTKNREYLFDTALEGKLKEVHSFLYTLTLLVDDILNMNLDNEPKNFISEVKSDLIVAFDLINMNYLKAAKQILRSSIEEFFRFCLSIQRNKEYEINKSKGVYSADESLKKLRSNIDTHKVGKMIHFTISKFSQTHVRCPIERLSILYGKLSSFVHVNKTENLTTENFLCEYTQPNQKESSDFLNIYNQTLNLIIIIVTYFYNYYPFGSSLTKRDWLNIKSRLSPDSCKIIESIENDFSNLVSNR